MWMLLMLLLAAPAAACNKGCTEYEGTCACDAPTEKAPSPPTPTSDERPPADKMPSYEREGIKAEMPQSLITQDAKMDQDRADAEAEGKKAAGIK